MEFFLASMDPMWVTIVKESGLLQLQYCLYCFSLAYLNALLAPIFLPGFNDLTKQQKLSWQNRGVSVVHAITMAFLAGYYWVVVNPKWVIEATISPFQARMLDIMMGYLWYDAYAEKRMGGSWDIVAHHGVGFLSHVAVRTTNIGVLMFYTMMIFVAEASTPFMHVCWLLHALKRTDSLVFKFLSFCLLFFFFFSRVINSPHIVYSLTNYIAANGVDNRPILFYSLWGSTIIFTGLNFLWFYMLIRMAFKPSKKVVD